MANNTNTQGKTKPTESIIFKIATKKTMATFKLNNVAAYDKIQCDIVEFDREQEAGQRAKQKVSCYISFEDALVFAEEVISGVTKKKAKANLAAAKGGFPEPVWSIMGGANEKIAKDKGYRTDGKALSRSVSIVPNKHEKYPYVIKAQEGPGYSNAQGLIVPKFENGQPEKNVTVSTDGQTIFKLAVMLKTHINAYMIGKYARREYFSES